MQWETDIINGFPHGVALLDANFRIIRLNSALEATTGYSSKQAAGLPSHQVIRDNIGREPLHRVRTANEQLMCRGDIIDANRNRVPMRFTVHPLRGGGDVPNGIMIVLEDVSLFEDLQDKQLDRSISGSIIGHSPGMQELFELLPVLAHTDAAVLITGETGTGKDLLAETIHQASNRSAQPFIKINCGALPETLLESELFGHQRGAFTGAHADKPGMFRLAQGGTIFLNEIGELPLHLQVKLLTVLDDMTFFPLGSSKPVSVDVRIITGTHRNLKQLVADGDFREDLFYRLNVLRAHLPPLRRRREDIPLLLNHFLKKIAANTNKELQGFGKDALELLTAYPYPGNVRELRNIVEYAVSICNTGRIESRHLPPAVLSFARGDDSAPGSLRSEEAFPAGTKAAGSWSEIEKEKILRALINTNGNRSKAARELGWGRSTLWRKIKQYGLG